MTVGNVQRRPDETHEEALRRTVAAQQAEALRKRAERQKAEKAAGGSR